jgi:leucyl aminopeptidase
MHMGQLTMQFCTNRNCVFLFGHYCKKFGDHAPISLLCSMIAEIFLSSQINALDTAKLPTNVRSYWNGLGELNTAYYQGTEGYFALVLNPGKNTSTEWEKLRKEGAVILSKLPKCVADVRIVNVDWESDKALAFVEGMLLADYRFDKYITKGDKAMAKNLTLDGAGADKFSEIQVICDAVKTARNWVNEPVNALNAQGLGEAFQHMGSELGFKVEVFGEAQIESLKMGGLLSLIHI